MFTFVKERESRRIVKISVSGAGKDALTKVAGDYGMKEDVVGGRIYEWVIRQDDIFQRAVLGLLKGLEVDAARVFMERLGKGHNPEEPAKDFAPSLQSNSPHADAPAKPVPLPEQSDEPETPQKRKGRPK